MGQNSGIVWTDSTFNPWMGCTKVSTECVNCYAEKNMACSYKHVKWGDDAARRAVAESGWKKPAAWERKAARTGQDWRVFCGSLCDVLDSHAPEAQRDRLFETIKQTPHLSWLLLTKRESNFHLLPEPLPENVGIGVTAGNQEYLEKRVSALRNVNARVRFVSYEPALGPLNLDVIEPGAINWLICGCESGSKRRPMEMQWARDVRDQCQALGIAFFMKQMEIDGEVTDEVECFPEDLRIRQYPTSTVA